MGGHYVSMNTGCADDQNLKIVRCSTFQVRWYPDCWSGPKNPLSDFSKRDIWYFTRNLTKEGSTHGEGPLPMLQDSDNGGAIDLWFVCFEWKVHVSSCFPVNMSVLRCLQHTWKSRSELPPPLVRFLVKRFHIAIGALISETRVHRPSIFANSRDYFFIRIVCKIEGCPAQFRISFHIGWRDFQNTKEINWIFNIHETGASNVHTVPFVDK